MALEEKNKMGVLIILFIGIILGIALLDSIADQIYPVTNLRDTNETVDITSARNETFWINNSVPFSLTNNWSGSPVVYNQTWGVLTENTDYVLNTTFYTIYFINSTDLQLNTSNLTFVEYNYEGDEYVNDSTSRVLINLVILLFSIAILFFIYMKIRGLGFDEIMGRK